MIDDINKNTNDTAVNVLHPHIRSSSFYWAQHEDKCLMDTSSIVMCLNVPITRNGRTYTFSNEDIKAVIERFS